MHGWAFPKDNRMVHQIWSDKNTVKLEIFTTFLFSRLSRIRRICEIKKSEKFYLFSYLTVKFGVCRAIMGVNITTLNKNDVKCFNK